MGGVWIQCRDLDWCSLVLALEGRNLNVCGLVPEMGG